MLFVYFLMLVFVANAESEQIISELAEIKSALSSVNLRLARIEDEQTKTELMYNRHEDQINCIEKENSEGLLWQKYTASLIKEQEVNDKSLETRQESMMSQVNQLVGNTDRCCQENMTVTCVNPGSAPLASIQPATVRPVIQDCKGVSDGVHQMKVGNEQISVYCSGGFMTFQRRYNGKLNFDRTYSEYEQGFGEATSEHWLGLRYLHEMTKDKSCTFRARIAVDDSKINRKLCKRKYASDCDGEIKNVVARDFRVSSAAEKYAIHLVLNHTDFLHPKVHHSFDYFSGLKFTTKDQDNDLHASHNCAALRNIPVNGGFWYQKCVPGYPNSVVSTDKQNCNSPVCGNWWPYYFSSSLLQFSC